jgi:PAS domain S-box-containing protein
MEEFLSKLIDVAGFAGPWQAGNLSAEQRWLHVTADFAMWAALAALSVALAGLLARRKDLPFRPLGWLFVAVMISYAALSLADLTLFWQPSSRLSGAIKAFAAALSWLAVVAVWVAVPKILALPNPSRVNELLQIEIRERERANERSKLVVEMAPNAILMANQNGRIVQVNAKAEQYFGFERAELIGQYVDSLVPPRLRNLPSGDLFAPHSGPSEPAAAQDLHGLRKDGSEFPIEVGVQPVVTEREVLVLIAISDVTLQKRAEAALKKSAAELQRSNGELAQFAYVASHDLKEPLRKVSSFCQLIKDRYGEKLDSDGRRYIDFAVDGAQRMQSLITDLLELSQVSSSDRPPSPVNAGAALDAALDNLGAAIEEGGAEVSHGPLPIVMADATQLTQLFQNLIGNAIKFRGARRPEVRVEAVARDGEWLLSIRDNGIGIAPAHRDRIFGIFQRLHTREEYPGTGIGLAVCKKIVERGGGRIWVESTPGEGTTFYFTFPQHAVLNDAQDEQGLLAHAT